MLPRTIFTAEHEAFRQTVRRFFTQEVVPKHATWEEQGFVDRSMWIRAGELGLLCPTVPEAYGGAGADRRYSTIVIEERAYARASAMGFLNYTEAAATYLFKFGTDEQRRHWLPIVARGGAVCSVAMTEPGTGSDLQAITTRAVRVGDGYVIQGAKTFISHGFLAELCIVAVKTRNEVKGRDEISLLLVEGDRPGLGKGPLLKKMGLQGQDTCELWFENVHVPIGNLLGGEEGLGLRMLMQELPWERLMLAISAVANARTAFDDTVVYTRDRRAFGQSVGSFQNTRFKLAEMKAEIEIGQVFVDGCLVAYMEGRWSPEAAAAAKYWTTEMLCRVVDTCVQLHGGYGYMMETGVARGFLDARVSRIFGGTNEIMREVVARSL